MGAHQAGKALRSVRDTLVLRAYRTHQRWKALDRFVQGVRFLHERGPGSHEAQ
jgi:hypothetical protein